MTVQETLANVEKALEEIRPFLLSDGGNIKLLSIEDTTVKVQLEGACNGCSVNQMTLKNGVEATIKKYAPQIEKSSECRLADKNQFFKILQALFLHDFFLSNDYNRYINYWCRPNRIVLPFFEAGLLKLRCHLIDALPQAGGQCSEIYPKKPIYDIPGFPEILAGDLTTNLLEQCKQFEPGFTLGERAETIEKQEDGSFIVTTQ